MSSIPNPAPAVNKILLHVQANILIDAKLHARLADFGLSAVTYDPNTVNAISTSSSVNGSIRWMAPELLNPEEAGLEHARPSPEADIYAFSMLMWEVGHIVPQAVNYTECLRG